MNKTFLPGQQLSGSLDSVPSKSYLHRALLAAYFTKEAVTIYPYILSEDVKATIACAGVFGKEVIIKEDHLLVQDGGMQHSTCSCNESGTTLRLMIPAVLASQERDISFVGKNKLISRPIDDYLAIMKQQGIDFTYEGSLPLTTKGKLSPGRFSLSGSVTSQYVSGMLMALPLLEGDSRLDLTDPLESKPYVDITLEVMASFGITVEDRGDHYIIPGNQTYKAASYWVEGDYSQAAFWLVAGCFTGPIRLKGLKPGSQQGDKELIKSLLSMGAFIYYEDQDIVVGPSKTHGAEIDVKDMPDIVPALCVLATVSEGTTRIYNTHRLKYKESDRGMAMVTELKKLGAKIDLGENEILIEGVSHLSGGTVESWKDHRIAMALGLASLVARDKLTIRNFEAVNKSYPHFIKDFEQLGGVIYE